MKRAFSDVETPGTDPQRHGVWSSGGILEMDGEEQEHFQWRCPLLPGDEFEEEALKVGASPRSRYSTAFRSRVETHGLTPVALGDPSPLIPAFTPGLTSGVFC